MTTHPARQQQLTTPSSPFLQAQDSYGEFALDTLPVTMVTPRATPPAAALAAPAVRPLHFASSPALVDASVRSGGSSSSSPKSPSRTTTFPRPTRPKFCDNLQIGRAHV